MPELLRQVLAAVFVIGLALLAAQALRRRISPAGAIRLWPASGTRRMRQLERLALTQQHSLHLLEIGGRRVLVAAHPGGCTVLECGAAAEGPNPC